jgi:RNA polymerase sigma-32 factor
MPSSPLSSYVARVRRHPRLTRLEERRLVRRLRGGADRQAAKTLVLAHLRTVVRIARAFGHLHPNLLELIQEGNLGLIRAVDRYDPAGPVTLEAYAASWARTYIVRYVLSSIGMVVDRDDPGWELSEGLHRSLRSLEAELGGDEIDGVDERDNQEFAPTAPGQPDPELVRLALLVDQDEEAPDQLIQDRQKRRLLEAALPEFERGLTPRERRIFHARLTASNPTTLSQTGKDLGLSAERVRQIEEKLKLRLSARLADQPSAAPPPQPVRLAGAPIAAAARAPMRQNRPSGRISSNGELRSKRRSVLLASDRRGPAPPRARGETAPPIASSPSTSVRSSADR